jgi:hypothetical protein
MAELSYWAIQYAAYPNEYPKDIDFYLTEPAYFDIELYGERWDKYCNPEEIIMNQTYTTNNGQPLQLKNWRHPSWLPINSDIPFGFVAKRYKVIIYIDSNRTSIINTITGNININDPYLIDRQNWFVSKISEVTPDQSVGINSTLNIFCKILQPLISQLTITVQNGTQSPIVLYDQIIYDYIREKVISFPFTFSDWATHKFIFKLLTSQGHWINNWCPPSLEYIEERETIITVGQQ